MSDLHMESAAWSPGRLKRNVRRSAANTRTTVVSRQSKLIGFLRPGLEFDYSTICGGEISFAEAEWSEGHGSVE